MTLPLDVLAVFLPLAGAVFAGLFGRRLGDGVAQAVACGGVFLAAVASVFVFYDTAIMGNVSDRVLFDWIKSGPLAVSWGIKIDTLSAVMLLVVNAISSMIHIYSVGYMAHDNGKSRFMSYMSLFTFFMLMLVTAPNLLQMFFGWEGVGLMSYLLIGFWYERPSANDASIKAFLVNRVGDFGFILGIFGCFALFGSVDFAHVFPKVAEAASDEWEFLGYTVPAVTTICLLLFIGAMGKSAQLGLHTWLPDAMEGPTPVSALIHAATMVTAGVFMVVRMSPMFEYSPFALSVVAIVGALTCIFAAVIGLTQFDIKRVIAYSTMSQLGYMFFAAGVCAYSASIFHLMTHAFFKALLFLCAGSVIHALSGEQDMRKMGGLWRATPWTYGLMWTGALALAGIGIHGLFGFAGFYSKDLILQSAMAQGTGLGSFVYYTGLVAAFMTAFYSWRLIFMTFHGEPREDDRILERVHESPWIMLAPLVPLAFGAVFAGWFAFDWFAGADRMLFWKDSIFILPGNDTVVAAEHIASIYKWLPLVVAVCGIGLAYVFYIAMPEMPAIVSTAFGGIYRLVYHKFYVDEFYRAAFVRPLRGIGNLLWRRGDDALIDGYGPDGIAVLTMRIARRVGSIETGYLYHYAFAMVIGVAGFVTWFFWF